MALWRIPIDGITVGTPEKLYGEVLTSLDGIDTKTWDASQITSGTLAAARIPNMDASKITTGTFAAARIPNLDAGKITTGTLALARGGTGRSVTTANRTYWCGRVLYDNSVGTTGTVTLSETAANFSFLVIGFCSDSNKYSSVFVYSPNGKKVNLSCVETEDDFNYLKTNYVTISGTSITRGSFRHTDLSGATTQTRAATQIYIKSVIGFA